MNEDNHGRATRRRICLVRKHMPTIVTVATVVLGVFFIAVTSPGHVPDIWAHVYRIGGILNGDVLARPVDSKSWLHGSDGNVGGHVDWTWINFSLQEYDGYDPAVIRTDTITTQDAEGADVPYNNTATNSPVAYLPQLVAFAVGKTFGMSARATYYLAEFAMLAVYASFMGLAVAVLPRWRILVGISMLCPLVMYRNAFAISADSFTQACVFLLTCMVFRTLYRRVSLRYCIAMALLTVCMAMCKFIYAPLMLLILLVPDMQHRLSETDAINSAIQRKTLWREPKLWICIIAVTVSSVWLVTWLRLTSWFVTTPMIVPSKDVDMKKQALLGSFSGGVQAIRAIGKAMIHGKSNMDNPTNSIVILCCLVVLLVITALVVASTVTKSLPVRMQVFWWCAWGIAVGIILLTYLALWLQYTPIGIDEVQGMQYRYFLPLTVLLVLCGAECVGGLHTKVRVSEGAGVEETRRVMAR